MSYVNKIKMALYPWLIWTQIIPLGGQIANEKKTVHHRNDQVALKGAKQELIHGVYDTEAFC